MPVTQLRLSLVGLPGSGKSTVGRQLAQRLSVSFTDLDHVIEQRIGCSISSFFEQEGETRFRDVEESVLRELAQVYSGVLATGGGTVLRLTNREHLRQAGHVIYLRYTPEEIFTRLRHDTTRPLMQVADPMARLRDLYEQRDPLYRETSHSVLEPRGSSVGMLVNKIITQRKLSGVIRARP